MMTWPTFIMSIAREGTKLISTPTFSSTNQYLFEASMIPFPSVTHYIHLQGSELITIFGEKKVEHKWIVLLRDKWDFLSLVQKLEHQVCWHMGELECIKYSTYLCSTWIYGGGFVSLRWYILLTPHAVFPLTLLVLPCGTEEVSWNTTQNNFEHAFWPQWNPSLSW